MKEIREEFGVCGKQISLEDMVVCLLARFCQLPIIAFFSCHFFSCQTCYLGEPSSHSHAKRWQNLFLHCCWWCGVLTHLSYPQERKEQESGREQPWEKEAKGQGGEKKTCVLRMRFALCTSGKLADLRVSASRSSKMKGRTKRPPLLQMQWPLNKGFTFLLRANVLLLPFVTTFCLSALLWSSVLLWNLLLTMLPSETFSSVVLLLVVNRMVDFSCSIYWSCKLPMMLGLATWATLLCGRHTQTIWMPSSGASSSLCQLCLWGT